MQSDWKEIYKLTTKRTGKSEQIYKDIGNYVFANLYKKLRRPNCLIIKLKGIGTWFLRRMRMRAIVELFPPNFDKKPEDFSYPISLIKHENKIEIYNIFKERLKEYDEYIKLRDEIRKKRYETQVLMEPIDREDKC